MSGFDMLEQMALQGKGVPPQSQTPPMTAASTFGSHAANVNPNVMPKGKSPIWDGGGAPNSAPPEDDSYDTSWIFPNKNTQAAQPAPAQTPSPSQSPQSWQQAPAPAQKLVTERLPDVSSLLTLDDSGREALFKDLSVKFADMGQDTFSAFYQNHRVFEITPEMTAKFAEGDYSELNSMFVRVASRTASDMYALFQEQLNAALPKLLSAAFGANQGYTSKTSVVSSVISNLKLDSAAVPAVKSIADQFMTHNPTATNEYAVDQITKYIKSALGNKPAPAEPPKMDNPTGFRKVLEI